jgi:hypothetical protein
MMMMMMMMMKVFSQRARLQVTTSIVPSSPILVTLMQEALRSTQT